MTSADSNNPEFDDLLLAIGSELAGERTEPVSLEGRDEDLRQRILHARNCLQLLGMTRAYSAHEIPTGPIEFPGQSGSTGIRVPCEFHRFQLTKSLGTGGFGDVFLANDPLLQRQVAVKIPHPRWMVDSVSRQRFLREARALGQLRHEAIVSIFESGEHEGTSYLVMEYCNAGNLDQFLTGLPQRQDPRVCASIVHQIAEGLGLAHMRGILHRDVKPRNVLLSLISDAIHPNDKGDFATSSILPSWKNIQPKLSDFGLAKWLNDEIETDKTQSGIIAGTLQYMAPEQAAGHSDRVSPATDVHGLGLVLYEMLTGQQPFVGDTPIETSWNIINREPIAVRTLRLAVPRDLETICHKALEKEPGRRYPSALEMTEDLKRFLEDREILAKPVSRPERLLRWCRHHPELSVLWLVVCVSIALLSAGGWWYSSRLAAAVESESKLRQQESRLLTESEQRESALLQQTERLEAAIRREQLLTYGSRMWQAQDLYHRGKIVDYASQLSAMYPSSPDGPDFRDIAWRVMNAKCGGELRPFQGIQNNDYRSVNVIPEKNLIVAGTGTGGFNAWDLESGAPLPFHIPTLSYHNPVHGITYQPQRDSWLYVIGQGENGDPLNRGRLEFWNAAAGMSKSLLLGLSVSHLSQSPDRTRFVLCTRHEKTLDFHVHAIETGECLWTISIDSDQQAASEGWGPDGSLVVPSNKHVRLYGPTGTLEAELSGESDNSSSPFIAATISSDGGLVAGQREDQSVDLWKKSLTGKFSLDRTIRVPDVPPDLAKSQWPYRYGIQFLNSNKWLALSGTDFRVYLWNLETNRVDCRSPKFQCPTIPIRTLPDGSLLLHECSLGLYRWKPIVDGPVLAGHLREAWTIDYSPDGRFLSSGSDDGTMKVWEVATGREVTTSEDHTQTVVRTRYSPSGTRLASLCLDGSLRAWEINPATGLPIGPPRLVDEHRKARSLTWSQNGRLIATGGNDGETNLWDADTLQVIRRYQDLNTTVRQILFLDGDRTLVTVSNSATVYIRNLMDNDRIVQRWQEESPVCSVALLSDGDTLALGLMRGVVCLRSRSTGKLIGVLTGHEEAVGTMALSPDGKVLASGDDAGWVRLWRSENQQPLVSIHMGNHKVGDLAFSPKGDSLAIATHDGKVTIWAAPFVE